MKYFSLFCFLLMTSCDLLVSESFEANDIPVRPATGYQRAQYLSPYIGAWQDSLEVFPIQLKARFQWIPENSLSFTTLYPRFSLGFNYFQNTGSTAQFSFAERLFFADVLDMIRFVVNSPVFEQEMLASSFFENDGVTPRSSQTILEEIRSIAFSISLAKRSLGVSVAAEATVGGFLHTIWVRDDTDYSRTQLQTMALVILHEITHNLGYAHSSGVNYGVHDPLMQAMRKATSTQVSNYISVTPYYEDKVINQVRTLITSSSRSRQSSSSEVSCTLSDIFGH